MDWAVTRTGKSRMIYLVGFICFYAGYCLAIFLMSKILNSYKEIYKTEEEIIYNSLRHLAPVQKVEVMQSIYGKNWMEHVPTED